MKVTVERTPESEAVLNVELAWDELEKASEKAYRKLAQKYKVPGFRPGHAPRAMLERMLGKEAIYQEGLEDLMDQSYREAIREHNLFPIAPPKVDAPTLEIGQPYTFIAHVPILSPVTLGDYQNIRVPMPPVEVTDEEIGNVVTRVQEDQAMWLPAERPAQVGDKVTMDMKVTVGEKTVSDLHDNEFELADERPGIFAGMDAHIIGMSEGDHKEFTTTIPEDYANPELAGKEANFDVSLKAVRFRELPAVDDELAKAIGEFTTMDEVRQAIREQLTIQKQNDADNRQREQILDEVAGQAEVAIHPTLIDDEVHTIMRETERQLAGSRITMEQFLQITGKTEEEYHKELEPQAEKRVKRDLVLSAIADKEDIQATEQDLEGWLAAFQAMGGKPMRARQLTATQRSNIEARIRRDAALRRLVQIASQDDELMAEASAKAAAQAAAEATAEQTNTTAAVVGAEPAQSEIAQAQATADEVETPAPAAQPPKAGKGAKSAEQPTSAGEAGTTSASATASQGTSAPTAESNPTAQGEPQGKQGGQGATKSAKKS